jgi:hypothetical protein
MPAFGLDHPRKSAKVILEDGMGSNLITRFIAVALLLCAFILICSPASAGSYYYSRSKYYPWAGQFPWDQRLTVNPDVVSGRLMSTSIYWPALTDYPFYCSTFVPLYGCRPGTYPFWWRW